MFALYERDPEFRHAAHCYIIAFFASWNTDRQNAILAWIRISQANRHRFALYVFFFFFHKWLRAFMPGEIISLSLTEITVVHRPIRP